MGNDQRRQDHQNGHNLEKVDHGEVLYKTSHITPLLAFKGMYKQEDGQILGPVRPH